MVSVAVTAISLVLAVPAAYGLTRLVRGGGRPMLVGILAAQFFPPMVFFVPFYIMLQSVGLLNTLTGLIFAYLSVTLPICTWMVATSLRDIPVELEEAARIDGCDDLRIICSIVLPIAAPGVVTAGVFAFVLSWQEYIFALLYTTSERAADRAGPDVLPARPAPDRLRAPDGGGRAPLDPHRRALRVHPALLPQRHDRRRHQGLTR